MIGSGPTAARAPSWRSEARRARLGSTTSVTLLNLDDRIAQIDLAQGTLNLRVRRIYPDQVFEIDTPNLAFSIRRRG